MLTAKDLKSLTHNELIAFVSEYARDLTELEALAILDNRFTTPSICQKIAQNERLTAYYSVRLRLVAHRQTPQAFAAKLVHYLYWVDLVRLSVEMTVPAPIRRAIDNQLLARARELSLGEKIASARRCSAVLIKEFLFDPDAKVFEALLVNSRLREDELLFFASSPKARPAQLGLLAADMKWSFRYAIRKALAANPRTPRAAAAAQLRYLRPEDLRKIHSHPDTSVYVRRCIERLATHSSSASMRRRID